MSCCSQKENFVTGDSISDGISRAICYYFKDYDDFCETIYYRPGDPDIGLQKLEGLDGFVIYCEEIPQNFITPSFHIYIASGTETKEVGNNYMFFRIIQVRYYPKKYYENANSHLDMVNQRLYEALKLISPLYCDMAPRQFLHTYNHTWSKDQGVLVRTFNVNFNVNQVLLDSPKQNSLDINILNIQ